MDYLSQIKLKNALYISLIDNDQLIESNNFFNIYYNELLSYEVPDSLKEEKESILSSMFTQYMEKLLFKASEYINEEKWAKAIICYEIAYSLDNNVFNRLDVIKSFITCLVKTNQKDLASDMISHFLKLTENDIQNYKWVAGMFHLMNYNEQSVLYMEKYINATTADEISSDDYNWLGVYYNRLFSENETYTEYAYKSIEYFEKAHNINPTNITYLHNITILCNFVNEYDKSYRAWQKIFKLGKVSEIQKYDYALLCMKLPKYEDWYKYYYARYSQDVAEYAFHNFKKPMWDGKTDISDKILLIHYEQGFGDNILMYGYMNQLKKIAKKIIFVVQEALYQLIKNNDSDIEVLCCNSIDYQKLNFDYFLPAMSIPQVLNLTPENISVGSGYLKTRQEQIDYYKKYFNPDKFKIGIAFHGNKNYNKRRNIPLTAFKNIFQLDNTEFYILNKEIDETELNQFKKNNVIFLGKHFQNFENTAAAIENCDLIISSDNCIMNIAGALGKKTLGIFNWSSEWRWFDLTGDDVIWYESIKPFVNKKMNDWENTLDNVKEYIIPHYNLTK